MKKLIGMLALGVLLFGLIGPAPVYAQRKLVIKMASPVPENTPWGAALTEMSNEWNRITGGEVELRIYHNGVLGTEDDVLRKLRINEIQAAVLTSFGLNSITPQVLTMSCPFLIRTDAELDYVLENLKADLEAKINAQGFFTLAWSRAGWVKFFSKAPVFTPADLRRQKVGTAEEEPELMQAFKAMGYQMVAVSNNDILIALNGGMVDAVYQSPIAVGSLQIFGVAKNMASINIAPFMGGIVLNQRAWRAVPDRYKTQLLAATRRIEQSLDRAILALEADAVRTMSQYGLVINQISPAQEQIWYEDVERAMPALVGTTFDRETYEKIIALLRTHRGRNAR
jgi:TRAP-type C4-dicarboxylate transport system substrate-binding protein